jgi:hypothetical protein
MQMQARDDFHHHHGRGEENHPPRVLFRGCLIAKEIVAMLPLCSI